MGLLVLLLSLSITVSNIGFSSWMSGKKQANLIEDKYITIAVPAGQNFEKSSDWGEYLIDNGNYIYSDGTKYIDLISAENTAKESEYYVDSDNRIMLSAHIYGNENLSSGTVDPLTYNFTLDQYPYQLAVMALRCTNIEETETYRPNYASYYASFEIIADVCRIDAYDLPPYEDTLIIESRLFTGEGTVPFEVGKTYLVRGRYWDYDVYGEIEDSSSDGAKSIRMRDTSGVFRSRTMLLDPEFPIMNTSDYPNWHVEEGQFKDSSLKYYYTPENCWPYYTEYTNSWEEFLESEDGLIWRDEIIPYFEMNHASAPVILTDNIQSMYYFNSGIATILDGEIFTDSDYIDGHNVCLVSASYADVNGLSVGDTINLDFHHTELEQLSYPVLQGTGRTGMTVVRYPLSENTRIGVQKNYMIIGIYSAPEWEAGSHSFHADTIFVPKASVANAGQYTGESLTM